MSRFVTTRKPVWLMLAIALSGTFAVLANAALQVSGARTPPSAFVPTGWSWVNAIVLPVWIVLIMGLVVAVNRLLRSDTPRALAGAWLLLSLLGFCVLYEPTFGRSAETGVVGNLLCAVLAGWVGSRVREVSTIAAAAAWAVALWASLATVYLLLVLRLAGLAP